MDNIKMDLRDLDCDSMDWIDLAQDRNGGRLCEYAGKFLNSYTTGGSSRRAPLHE
jgi:hypothetical protein